MSIATAILPAAFAQKAPNATIPAPSIVPTFTDADGTRVLDDLGQALESGNLRKFLKLFDASQMPDYPVFRDQIAALFEHYDGFRVHYHIAQVAMQEKYGVMIVDFELSAISGGADPNSSKQSQLRFATAWNGKQWKIVDVAPRAFFT